jgi:glycosidase
MLQTAIPVTEALDPVARFFDKLPRFIQNALQKITVGSIARDGCRTPMQWDGSDGGGFTNNGAASWLPINSIAPGGDVQSQAEDPDSLLSFYKEILHLRSTYSHLSGGPLSLLTGQPLPRTVLGYTRGELAVYLNFGKRGRTVELPQSGWELLLSTHSSSSAPTAATLYLKPWEGVILKEKE